MTVESPTTTLAAYIRENISALRDLDFETAEQADTLRNARSFLEALAKILEGGEARTAFGLPRDWGHSSRIGVALYALHQHRPARGPYAVHMGSAATAHPRRKSFPPLAMVASAGRTEPSQVPTSSTPS